MELTSSYDGVISSDLRDRYGWVEVRSAAAVIQASDPAGLAELLEVLDQFYIYDDDILIRGGNRGRIPIRLDSMLAHRGWVPVRVNTEVKLVGHVKASSRGRLGKQFLDSTVSNEGFEVDNMKRRIAVDVEWNAKDGNLDRDLSAYRALYDWGLIDAAVIITRDHEGIKGLSRTLGSEDAERRLGTSTTTQIVKLTDRLKRGDAGGCPVLGVALTHDTWAGAGVQAPSLVVPASVDTSAE